MYTYKKSAREQNGMNEFVFTVAHYNLWVMHRLFKG